jgi:hypothetical protein
MQEQQVRGRGGLGRGCMQCMIGTNALLPTCQLPDAGSMIAILLAGLVQPGAAWCSLAGLVQPGSAWFSLVQPGA